MAERSLTVTLSEDLMRLVEERVGSGAYADASAVVRDGLQALADRDTALDAWLRNDVAATYDRVASGEEPLVPSSDVFGGLEARAHRRRTTADRG
ncbi:hypothetical protein A33M_4342 [Rhodovulum sp. PH10]|uniref:ribbon-helix-helix domain-containing protein n=1 Tax=Rhodovulum sp. PH10 TaxID=1187851 RepID=UPI00027C2D44|nr:type II toxin-antitoxin system ParD family antitoxin [Rhodovulum sp. PH10]EJW10505.1 hypothetical protein A33M_4342 [Rhodovulum sp. PH10]